MTGKKAALYFMGMILCLAATFVQAQEKKSDQESLYSKGLHLYLDGQYEEAAGIFDQYMNEDLQDPRSCYFSGLCKLKLGDIETAKYFFLKGAAREYTPKGRLLNVAAALTKIQGQERFMIEEARAIMKKAWEKREEERQIKMYGETVRRQKDLLSQENRFLTENPNTGAPKKGESGVAADLPVVSPISPLSKEEHDVAKIPDIGNVKSEDYKFFRDELGKTILSTSERKRIEERERRVVYTDPMQKPAADGTEFINIYDPMQRYVDTKPFVSDDDPDDLYQEAESSPLAVVSMLLDTKPQGKKPVAGSPNEIIGGMPGGMDGPPSPMDMGGMPGDPAAPGAGNLPKRTIKNETAIMFRGKDVPNSHTGDNIAIPDPSKGLDLFENDRKYAPPAKEPAPGENPDMPPME
ncbi:MAG: tetratricopeptide repeat protein [Planctomycetia bacterium]|nr:tetratricopeptide repeat protein [Planctomycetia bacterium]